MSPADYSDILLSMERAQKDCSDAARKNEWMVAISAATRIHALSNALIEWFDSARNA
jgi:hypothetical protein